MRAAWFTLEYLLRLWSAPRRLLFLVNFINVIDAIAVLSFYALRATSAVKTLVNWKSSFVIGVLQFLRVMRVLRVLKLARHSSDMKVCTSCQLLFAFTNIRVLLTLLSIVVMLVHCWHADVWAHDPYECAPGECACAFPRYGHIALRHVVLPVRTQ